MAFIIDFIIVGGLIITLTAFLGVIPNVFSEKVLGRNHSKKFKDKSDQMTAGFNNVGGNGIKRKSFY